MDASALRGLMNNQFEPKIFLVPIVVEQTGRGERSWDIYSRLLVDRILFLGTPVDDNVLTSSSPSCLFLQMADPKKDVHLYINSPGGSVTAGLAIYDTIQYMTCDVNTYCVGQAASMGAVLLAAGAKGKRFALPNSNIMIHQVLGGAEGQASDVEIRVKHMLKLKQTLNGILSNTRASRLNRWSEIATAIILCPPTKQRITAWWTKSCSRGKKFPAPKGLSCFNRTT